MPRRNVKLAKPTDHVATSLGSPDKVFQYSRPLRQILPQIAVALLMSLHESPRSSLILAKVPAYR